MERLVAILEGEAGPKLEGLTPYGILAPPLGLARLKASEVVGALLYVNSAASDSGAPKPLSRFISSDELFGGGGGFWVYDCWGAALRQQLRFRQRCAQNPKQTIEVIFRV